MKLNTLKSAMGYLTKARKKICAYDKEFFEVAMQIDKAHDVAKVKYMEILKKP